MAKTGGTLSFFLQYTYFFSARKAKPLSKQPRFQQGSEYTREVSGLCQHSLLAAPNIKFCRNQHKKSKFGKFFMRPNVIHWNVQEQTQCVNENARFARKMLGCFWGCESDTMCVWRKTDFDCERKVCKRVMTSSFYILLAKSANQTTPTWLDSFYF